MRLAEPPHLGPEPGLFALLHSAFMSPILATPSCQSLSAQRRPMTKTHQPPLGQWALLVPWFWWLGS